MLDPELKLQLSGVFSKLGSTVILAVRPSSHEFQPDLDSMLDGLAAVAPERIRINREFQTTRADLGDAPYFELHRESGPTGISFRGVPGGHEFSSLVLSILYADGKGKQPDSGIISRIRGLKGPIRLQTFISLSCENCPEVVQALNLMSVLHPDFQHEMIDGAVARNEVESLGIQGVPSVMHEGRLVHSGKIQLVDLLAKLEETFGKSTPAGVETDLGLFDVVVVGGGPAGASAAIYSVRKGLKTAIVAEKFGGQLQETKGIENMISVSYTEGTKLAAQLAEHVAAYPVQLLEHRRVNQIIDQGSHKRIKLESGEFLDARSVVIATGAKWRQLGIPGEKEHIGQGVAFCAHCDGPFYKGKRVVVVGGGNSGVEAAIDLAGIAKEVTLLEFNDNLKADDILVSKVQALPNTRVITQAKTTRVVGDGKKVVGLEYQDRITQELRMIEADGVFVQIGLLPNTQFLKGVVELTPYGEVVVDPRGRTSVPRIYAAGDVTTIPFKQIVVAMGDGAKVALTAFEDRLHSTESA